MKAARRNSLQGSNPCLAARRDRDEEPVRAGAVRRKPGGLPSRLLVRGPTRGRPEDGGFPVGNRANPVSPPGGMGIATATFPIRNMSVDYGMIVVIERRRHGN